MIFTLMVVLVCFRKHSCLYFTPSRFLYFQDNSAQMVDDVNDVRIIGTITVIILLCITFAGMAWEAKVRSFALVFAHFPVLSLLTASLPLLFLVFTPPQAQILFFIALLLSLVNYFVGTVIPPSTEKQAMGFFGYRGEYTRS